MNSKMLVVMTLPDNGGRYGAPGSTYKLIKRVERSADGNYPILPAICITWRLLSTDVYYSTRGK